MSIEYEVRSDDAYSRHVSAVVAREILQAHWYVKGSLDSGFLYEGDQCHVEIQFGSEDESTEDSIDWIGLRIPAGARLESATRAVEIGMTLAQGLGWRLFDPQSDTYVEASDLLPGPPLREALAQLAREVKDESARALGRRLWLRGRRQSLRSIGEIAFGALLLVFVSDRLFGFGFAQRPGPSVGLIAGLTALIVMADILLDVLGEIHTAAGARSGSRPNHAA